MNYISVRQHAVCG